MFLNEQAALMGGLFIHYSKTNAEIATRLQGPVAQHPFGFFGVARLIADHIFKLNH